MVQFLKQQRAAWLIVGVMIGLAAGGVLPHVPLHASATHGQEGFAVCTAMVESGNEAVCFLDSLTGDLKAAYMAPTGKFTVLYATNVLKDMGLEAGKTPKFLLVSGVTQLRQAPGQPRVGQSVLYVTDAASGEVAAYAFPLTNGQQLALRPLDSVKLRTVAIRPGT